MTANTDMPDAVGEGRHPYGPCHHTKYEGCPPCVHSAWDEGVQAARDAVKSREDGEYFQWVQVEIALAAIDRLREKP